MKKIFCRLMFLTIAGVVSCDSQSNNAPNDELGNSLVRLKEESGMTDDDFDKALRLWVNHIEVVMELSPDHPLVKSGTFSVEDMRKQYEQTEILFEEIAAQKRQQDRFNVILLGMLNENRMDDTKKLLRSQIVEVYRIAKKSDSADNSGFVESVDNEAVRDLHLKGLLQHINE